MKMMSEVMTNITKFNLIGLVQRLDTINAEKQAIKNISVEDLLLKIIHLQKDGLSSLQNHKLIKGNLMISEMLSSRKFTDIPQGITNLLLYFIESTNY